MADLADLALNTVSSPSSFHRRYRAAGSHPPAIPAATPTGTPPPLAPPPDGGAFEMGSP